MGGGRGSEKKERKIGKKKKRKTEARPKATSKTHGLLNWEGEECADGEDGGCC